MALPPYKNKGITSTARVETDALKVSGVDVSSFVVAGAAGTTAVSTGLTASTTQTLAGALKLTSKFNYVATSANSGDAVSLPAMTPGQTTTIFNDGANPIKVFPSASNIAIDGGSNGAAVTLTNAKRASFHCKSATAITSAQLGVASA